MAASLPRSGAPKKPPLLERAGSRYLRARESRLGPVEADDEIHFLNESERQALRAIQHGAMIRGAIAGALSATVVAVGEASLFPALGLHADSEAWTGLAGFYGALLVLSGVAAVVEIGYLYFDALRSVHDLARSAGLELGADDDDEAVAAALARAALELPDPREPVFGVDPSREVAGWRLVAITALYKAKIALTSFLMKALLRRALGRALVRSWLPFVAVPVTALWNVAICWKVLREARLRVMGPSAVEAVLDRLFEDEPPASAEAEAAVRAAAVIVVKKHRLHPNHRVLLARLCHRLGHPEADDLDEPHAFFERLGALAPFAQTRILTLMVAAIALDGRLSPRDRALLESATRAVGRPPLLEEARRVRGAFVDGHGLDEHLDLIEPTLEVTAA